MMAILAPIFILIVLLIVYLTIAAISIAFATTATSVKTVSQLSTSRAIKVFIFFVGGLGFAYSWFTLGPVPKGDWFDRAFEWGVKFSLPCMAGSITMMAAALSLKFYAWLINKGYIQAKRSHSRLYLVIGLGALAGLCTLIAIEKIYYKISARPPPIMLSFDGEPTHCVWKDTTIRDRRNWSASRPIKSIRLSRGQKIRLDPRVRLTTESFTVRFGVETNGETKIYYGNSTDFRLLDFRVDQNCQW